MNTNLKCVYKIGLKLIPHKVYNRCVNKSYERKVCEMGNFKIGHKVRIVRSNYINDSDKNKIGVISDVLNTNYCYEVDFGKSYAFTHTDILTN